MRKRYGETWTVQIFKKSFCVWVGGTMGKEVQIRNGQTTPHWEKYAKQVIYQE